MQTRDAEYSVKGPGNSRGNNKRAKQKSVSSPIVMLWKILKWKNRMEKNLHLVFLSYRFPSVLFLGPAHAPAWLEVGSDTFSWPLVKLRELAITCIKYGLYLVFRLLRNRHHSVQVLVHKQPHEHLKWKQTKCFLKWWNDCKSINPSLHRCFTLIRSSFN